MWSPISSPISRPSWPAWEVAMQSFLGRGDQVSHGGAGPDPRELPPKGLRTRDIYVPDLQIDTIKVRSRNFH